MSTGASLENSSLRWLMELEGLQTKNTNAVNRVLQVSAQEMLEDLRSSYSKAIRSEGRTNIPSAQQQYARANNIANQVGDLVGPQARKTILDRMNKDLTAAQRLGSRRAWTWTRSSRTGRRSSTRTRNPTAQQSKRPAAGPMTSGRGKTPRSATGCAP